MFDMIIKILEIGVQILIPIIIIFIGRTISNKLDENRNNFELEKEWKVKWADTFYEVAIKYNKIVTDYVMEFYKIDRIDEEKELNTKRVVPVTA